MKSGSGIGDLGHLKITGDTGRNSGVNGLGAGIGQTAISGIIISSSIKVGFGGAGQPMILGSSGLLGLKTGGGVSGLGIGQTTIFGGSNTIIGGGVDAFGGIGQIAISGSDPKHSIGVGRIIASSIKVGFGGAGQPMILGSSGLFGRKTGGGVGVFGIGHTAISGSDSKYSIGCGIIIASSIKVGFGGAGHPMILGSSGLFGL